MICDSTLSNASSSRSNSCPRSNNSLSNSLMSSNPASTPFAKASCCAAASCFWAAARARSAATHGEHAMRTKPWHPRLPHMRVSPRSIKGAPGSPPPLRAAMLGRGMPWQRSRTGSFLRWILSSFRTERYVSRTSSNSAASISPGDSPPAPRWACMPLSKWQSRTAALEIM